MPRDSRRGMWEEKGRGSKRIILGKIKGLTYKPMRFNRILLS